MADVNEPSWIWKIFGGTILAMVTLLFVTLFNSINQNITSSKQESINLIMSAKQESANLIADIKAEIRDNRQILDSFKDRLAVLENSETRTKLDSLVEELKTIEKDINSRSEKVISNETSLINLKEDVKIIREELKVINTEIKKVKKTALLDSEILD